MRHTSNKQQGSVDLEGQAPDINAAKIQGVEANVMKNIFFEEQNTQSMLLACACNQTCL
jgi:hypothetical protein